MDRPGAPGLAWKTPSPSSANGSGGSSGRQRRSMGFCRSASRRWTGLCRVAGSPAARCTKSLEQMATKRMAHSPPFLPPISSDGSPTRREAWCSGVCRTRISMGLVLPPTGSTPVGSCWFKHGAMQRSCGQWKRGCALPASQRLSAKSGRFLRWRAVDSSSPQNIPGSPHFCCGAGARANRRRANAFCRMRL